MNKQLKLNKDGTVKSRGIEWTDFTWNPIGGCFHACQWVMPSGEIANCYAEDVAEGIAGKAYPQGFEHYYWHPSQLKAPMSVKTPAKIFVGSMTDVFGHWTQPDHVEQVIDVAYYADWHVFQFLTKNFPKVQKFTLPKNCWLGASSPPDFMWNHPMSKKQKEAMLHRILQGLSSFPDNITWMSMEPYSWDMVSILEQYPKALNWVVVGAASNGSTYYPPAQSSVERLCEYLESNGIPTFFKGNIRSLPWARENWREEFPNNSR